MEKPRIIAYHVWIVFKEVPNGFHIKPDLYYGISENCRLCHGGAELETMELAQEYLDALVPIFERRYGKNVVCFGIGEIGGALTKDTIAMIKKDSDIVRWRLENSDFNPKSKPDTVKK